MAGARGTFGVYVVIRPAALQRLLESPTGPVTRDLLVRGERVKVRAQQLVGVHEPQAGERRGRRPGTLRDSIVKRLARNGKGVACIVGSEDPIALWHHEGTVPHRIVPRNARLLRFVSGGRVVYARGVNHPGTQPNRFLTDALPAARG